MTITIFITRPVEGNINNMTIYDSGVGEIEEELVRGFGVPIHVEDIEVEVFPNDEGFDEPCYEMVEWSESWSVEREERVEVEEENIISYADWVVIEVVEDWDSDTEEYVEKSFTFILDTDILTCKTCE